MGETHKHDYQKSKLTYIYIFKVKKSFLPLDPKLFTIIYHTYILPILEFACPIWSPHYQKDIAQLERVQRRATKMVRGFRYLSYDERLQRLNLPSLVSKRSKIDLVETYKILNNAYSFSLSEMFVIAETRQLRGHSRKLMKQKFKKLLRQNFFSFRVVNSWNNLPNEVVTAPSIACFKRRLFLLPE
jgi:hypothetical protein